MTKELEDLMYKSGLTAQGSWDSFDEYDKQAVKKLAELIVLECIDKIETYRIPVGNSRSGELAYEWTYNALYTIRDEIRTTFGIKK